ncbi:MAG: sigma-70 family RNA polymerase sigma factor [Chloroflexaceae bacterium]|jgi:RNA polymerase sigma-70 factor (ECF subfamily)|nr:sigma-70 family RNA polymerase sigma factor [Chloroflexaceae bacterium]
MDSWAGLPEQRLLTLAQRGVADAYGELVRRYQGELYNVVYRLLGDQHESLDLTQESFVQAYNALASFDTSRPFGPWIKRIATNLALNWLQRRHVLTTPLTRPAQPGAEEPEELALPDVSTEPERVYLAGERHELLRQALLALPPHYRAVIELRHFQELSYEEIAVALKLPLSDVKSNLFRARQLLRKRLEGEV